MKNRVVGYSQFAERGGIVFDWLALEDQSEGAWKLQVCFLEGGDKFLKGEFGRELDRAAVAIGQTHEETDEVFF